MKNTIPIQSRIDEENFTELQKAASRKVLSISMMIRFIILQFLEGDKK